MATLSMPHINWDNLVEVKAFADRLGPGMVVIKTAHRRNYNITHENRKDRWDRKGVTVVYRTTQGG